MTKTEQKRLTLGLFVTLLIASMATAGVVGYISAPEKAEGKGVLSSETQDALRAEYGEKQKELERAHARAVFKKRQKVMELREVSVPLEEYLDEYTEKWGEKLYAVPKKLHRSFNWSPFVEEMRLNGNLQVYLRITPAERQALEMLVAPMIQTLRDEELRHVTVKESTPTRVVLIITPFPEKGREFKEQFRQNVIRILGRDRAGFFMSGRGWDDSFKGFGRGRGTYRFFKERGRWRSITPYVSCFGIDKEEAGRFYDYLPDELKKKIPAKYVYRPPAVGTEDTQ